MEKEKKEYDCFSVEEKDFLNYLRRGRAERKNSVYMICLPHLQNDSLTQQLIKDNLDCRIKFIQNEGRGKSKIALENYEKLKRQYVNKYDKYALKIKTDDEIKKKIYEFKQVLPIGLTTAILCIFMSPISVWFGFMGVLCLFFCVIMFNSIQNAKLVLEFRRK